MAASIAGAGIVDPLVERMSNAGMFGPGSFTDRSNVDVIPALCLAAVFCGLSVYVLARRLLSERAHPPRWLRRCATEVGAGPWYRLLPSIFAVQIGVLFCMETLEQLAVAGHPYGGTIWLGGPVGLSLLMHAAGCIAITWLLSRVLDWSARTLAAAVRCVFAYVRAAAAGVSNSPRLPLRFDVRAKSIDPYLRALAGRAPPAFLPVSTH